MDTAAMGVGYSKSRVYDKAGYNRISFKGKAVVKRPA
jgi:hypothetical protein